MKRYLALGVGAIALAVGGFAAATQLDTGTTTSTVMVATTVPLPNCNEWGVQLTAGECAAAGAIRYAALHNLQGAAQFCKWKAANPGEWARLKASETEASPINIVTWLGASIRDDLQAYFGAGGPTFIIEPNTAPNICKTPIAGPTGLGVTGVDETSLTLTWTGP